MPVDRKYGQVELEYPRSVGEDEPVFIFRAKDVVLPRILAIYHDLCVAEGSPENHLKAIADARQDIITWQVVNGSKVPTSEPVAIPVEELLEELDG